MVGVFGQPKRVPEGINLICAAIDKAVYRRRDEIDRGVALVKRFTAGMGSGGGLPLTTPALTHRYWPVHPKSVFPV